MRIHVAEPKNHLWKRQAINGIHAEFTDNCNSGCPMCPRYINNGAALNPHLARTEVSLEQFKTWFDLEFVKGLKKLYACGNYGDPIAARDTLEIYRYLRGNNEYMALSMHTNGSARPKEWWADLGRTMDSSVRGDYCTFSVDGLADTNHLYRRNTKFDKIMENAEAFIAAGGVAHWDFIVFDYNEHQVEEAKALATRMGFENFNIKRTTRWAKVVDGRGEYDVRGKDGEVAYTLRQPRNDQYRDETLKILRQNMEKPNYITEQEFDRLTFDNPMFQLNLNENERLEIRHDEIEIQCRAVRGAGNSLNEIFLSATGHVFPCCFLGGEPWRYNGRHENKFSGDNIMKMIDLNGGMDSISLQQHSLKDIINSPIYSEMLARSFRQGHSMRSRQCSTCCGKTWNKLDYGELGSKPNSYLDPSKAPVKAPGD